MKLHSLMIALILTSILLVRVHPAAGDDANQADIRYQVFVHTCNGGASAVPGCQSLYPLCQAAMTVADVEAAKNAPALCTAPAGAPGASGTGPQPNSINWIPVVADFLIARARAELALYLKDHIANALCERPIGAALLPATCTALQGADDSLTGLPGTLRSDLEALPVNLIDQVPQHLPASAQVSACMVNAAAVIFPRLRDKGPVAALDSLGKYQPATPCSTVIDRLPKLARIVEPTVEAAITRLQRRQDLDQTAFRASLRDAAIAAGIADPAVLARLDDAVPQLAVMIAAFRDADPSKPIDRASAVRAAEALARALALLAPTEHQASLREAMLAAADFATGRYASGLAHLAVSAKDLLPKDDQFLLATLLRYGVLLGSLATAESDDEVRAILESAAAPLGSYRDYRRGFAGYLGALAGVGGGVELGVGNATAAGAPFLPLGVELGGPVGEHSSWNVLVSVADLGAVAATRLGGSNHDTAGTTDTVKTNADPGFASVFAPGLFGSIGLGNSPFIIGIGAEYLPANRQVFDCPDAMACSTTRRDPVVRAMAFVAIDLPILPLFR